MNFLLLRLCLFMYLIVTLASAYQATVLQLPFFSLNQPVSWIFYVSTFLTLALAAILFANEGMQPVRRSGMKDLLDMSSPAALACLLGIPIGSLVGYLLVPSVPLVGKLPLRHILTRGVFLEGLDKILVSVAETSFNYMLVGAITGGLLGIGWAYLSSVIKGESQQRNKEDIAEQLKKLATLRDQNLLTEEEFQAKKAELLKRL